jgi:hypothetical protein
MTDQPASTEQNAIPMRFGDKFLSNYAPNLISDPEVAIVEIISNCWDAGADQVDITWPNDQGRDFVIADNGTGMTFDEFIKIWSELSYNRADEGKEVKFPSGNRTSLRKIFGRNGKGRLSLFCFDDEYIVETAKDGEKCRFRIERKYERGNTPFLIHTEERVPSQEHGTKLICKARWKHIATKRLIELIGSKFISQPSFEIYVDDTRITLTDLKNIGEKSTLNTIHGTVDIYVLDSGKRGRTSQQHGVAWWVNGRGVGKQGWKGPNGTSLIDARTTEAMRYTFIVIANILESEVKDDWTGFVESERTEHILDKVNQYIQKRLDDLFAQKRLERRKEALKLNREKLKPLSSPARQRVGKFIDELQTEVPTLKPEHLNAAVGIFANLEQTRSGYLLLQQLAKLTPEDTDKLSDILSKWSVQDAQIVLEELDRRLKLIEKLDEVVDKEVDELHVIHPLIEKGLWIFGPEYESINFTSNKGLNNVIRKLIGDKEVSIDEPRRRPDFVALPNGRVGSFSIDDYDENSEVNGIAKVLIVELKRGGFVIGNKEIRQAEDYAQAIVQSGHLSPNAKIVCFVLGTTLDNYAQKRTLGDDGQITIHPRTYRTLIQQAQARTFHLKTKIERARPIISDTQIDEVLLLR